MPKVPFKNVAIGTAVAAAAGYVAGVLTAPRAGSATRNSLRGTANDKISGVENQFHTVQEEVKHLIDEANTARSRMSEKALQEVDDAKTLAVDARDKAQQVLAAVRKGQADDAQLQRAVNDVKAAGKHLKMYLTKTPGKVTKAKSAKAPAKKASAPTKNNTKKSTSKSSKGPASSARATKSKTTPRSTTKRTTKS